VVGWSVGKSVVGTPDDGMRVGAMVILDGLKLGRLEGAKLGIAEGVSLTTTVGTVLGAKLTL
jgi:hypothetical protein